MALPIINAPQFETTIPSTNQKIFFRPFLVKEEKILFVALQGGEMSEIVNAIKNILRECIIDNVDVDKLATFDLEYLFLQLRSKSVGEEINLRLNHQSGECTHRQDVTILVDDVKVNFDPQHTDKVMIDDNIGIKFKYPNFKLIEQFQSVDSNDMQQLFDLLLSCVDFVYDQDNVYDQFTDEELKNFFDALNQKQFNKVTSFFNTLPRLSHTIEWTCDKCGESEKVVLEGLSNFFT